MKTLRTLAAVALVATLAPTSPASADTGSDRYPRNDGIPASIDVVRLRVDNAGRRAVMTMTLRDLTRRGQMEFYYWRGGTATPPPQSVLVVVERKAGAVKATFTTCDTEVCLPEPCAGLRTAWRPAADIVRVSIPQRCYPRPEGTPPPTVGRFFVGAELGDQLDPGNGGDPLRLRRG